MMIELIKSREEYLDDFNKKAWSECVADDTLFNKVLQTYTKDALGMSKEQRVAALEERIRKRKKQKNNRSPSKKDFGTFMESIGRKLSKVAEDGNCLFASIWSCVKSILGDEAPKITDVVGHEMIRWLASELLEVVRWQLQISTPEDDRLTMLKHDFGIDDDGTQQELLWAQYPQKSTREYGEAASVCPIICGILQLNINVLFGAFIYNETEEDPTLRLSLRQWKFSKCVWEAGANSVYNFQNGLLFQLKDFVELSYMDDRGQVVEALRCGGVSGSEGMTISILLYNTKSSEPHYEPINVESVKGYESTKRHLLEMINMIYAEWQRKFNLRGKIVSLKGLSLSPSCSSSPSSSSDRTTLQCGDKITNISVCG